MTISMQDNSLGSAARLREFVKLSKSVVFKGTRTHLKNAFGLQSANFYSAIFSGLIVLSVRIVPAAMASQRNSLDFAFKAVFEMGSSRDEAYEWIGRALGKFWYLSRRNQDEQR